VAVALLSGTGQFFWWNKIDKQKLKKEFLTSSLITLVVFVIIMLLGDVKDPLFATPDRCRYIHYRLECKVLAGVWACKSQAFRRGDRAHRARNGLIGILFSAGYSKWSPLTTPACF